MTDVAPSLSVIVASTVPLRETPACLPTLAAQCRGRHAEVILAYSDDHDASKAKVMDLPGVSLIHLPRESSLPRLLGAAIARATGEIIAIADAACEIDERFVSAILKAHEAPYPVIGGAVEPHGLRKLVDWAAYFCEYGQFMLPLAEGVVHEVPGNNLSVKRWALARGREFVHGEFWKTYWCRRIQADGFQLYAAPSIVVYYGKSFPLWRFLVRRFHHGRCFAGMRIPQLSQVKRVFHVVGSPLLPILFCARTLRAVLPKRRQRHLLFLSFPIIVLATISWAIGEFFGYLVGAGASCRHVR